MVNTTEPRIYLKLNCCLTYEITVTAWNRNGPSFTDPDNAATITVLRGNVLWCVFVNATVLGQGQEKYSIT